MSINTWNKNYIDETNKFKESNVEERHLSIYDANYKQQTIIDKSGKRMSSISFTNENKLDSSNNTKSVKPISYTSTSEAMGLDSRTLVRIQRGDRTFLSPAEYEKIKKFFQERLLPNSLHHLEPFDPSKLSDIKPGKIHIENFLYQQIMGGVDEIIEKKTPVEAPVHKNFQNALTRESLTTYAAISRAMGLDKLITQIKHNLKRYLAQDAYEKIKKFFQEHLSDDSLNHLEPFDPSKLSDIKPGMIRIETPLQQKILGGVDEIIKKETQNEAAVHKNFQAAVINYPPEKPASINNEKRIDLTEEVNPLDQAVVERVSKKAKTILNDRQPSAFYQNAVLVNQSFSLEQAFQSIQEATTTSPIEAVQPFTACAVDDDLFYNIPEEQLFLSAGSVQTPPTNTQTSPAQLLLDDLLFPSPPDDDAFPLESTEEAFQSTQEATTTSPIEDDQPSAQKQTAFHIDDDLFYNIPEDELFLSAGSVQIPPTNTQTSPAQDDLFLTFSSDDDAFPLESTWNDI